MISQIYLPNTHKFFTTYVNDPPFSFNFFLGSVETYKVIEDKNNRFISLGGDPDNPLAYKFLEDGWTEFNFKIFDINTYIDGKYAPFGVYELWIDGIKPYYYYHEKRSGTFFDATICVKGKKDQISKFKFRLSIQEAYSFTPRVNEYRYKGSEDTIYSCITAKFIPDSIPEQKKEEPIIVKKDTKLQMNRRYLVYALYAKILQLDLPDEIEIGDWIEIKNMEFGNFRVNSNKADIVMNGKTTRAKNGYIQSIKRGDFVRLECLEKSSERTIITDTNTVGIFTIL